jgi:hypothetical protein
VNLPWQCYQQLRRASLTTWNASSMATVVDDLGAAYHAELVEGRRIAQKIIDTSHSCPIPEIA